MVAGGRLHSSGGTVNRKLRDEPLNREIFYTLREAKVLVEQWRQEYNRIRPHSSLGNLTPVEYAEELLEVAGYAVG